MNISLYTVKRICYEIYCKYVFFFSENESDINDDSFNEDFIPSSSDSDSGSDVFPLVMSKAGKKHHHKKRGRTVPILLTSKVNISINVLLETRDNVGVRTDNPYERPSEAVMS